MSDDIDFLTTKKEKDFLERLTELMKDDKELHDAFVRAVNAMAEGLEIRNAEKKERFKEKHGKKENMP